MCIWRSACMSALRFIARCTAVLRGGLQEEWDNEKFPEGFELSGSLPEAKRADEPAAAAAGSAPAAAPASAAAAAAAAAPLGKAVLQETDEGIVLLSSDEEEDATEAAAPGGAAGGLDAGRQGGRQGGRPSDEPCLRATEQPLARRRGCCCQTRSSARPVREMDNEDEGRVEVPGLEVPPFHACMRVYACRVQGSKCQQGCSLTGSCWMACQA